MALLGAARAAAERAGAARVAAESAAAARVSARAESLPLVEAVSGSEVMAWAAMVMATTVAEATMAVATAAETRGQTDAGRAVLKAVPEFVAVWGPRVSLQLHHSQARDSLPGFPANA